MVAALLLRRIRGGAAQCLALRSLSSQVVNQVDRHEDQINSISSYVIKALDDVITSDPQCDIVYEAYDMMTAIQKRSLSRVFDTVQYYPPADPCSASMMKSIVKPYEVGSAEEGLTKDKVISVVHEILTFNHKVDESKLMGDGHFDCDLGWSLELWNSRKSAVANRFNINLVIPEQIESCKLLIEYVYVCMRSLSSPPSDDQINALATLVIKIVDEPIKYFPHYPDFDPKDYYGEVDFYAFLLIRSLPVFRAYPTPAKMKIISTVFDHIKNYPHFPDGHLYTGKAYIRSMTTEDSKEDISKEQVISRVLDCIKNNPKVDQSKVTQESRFEDLVHKDEDDLLYLLMLEFKLEIPEEIVCCKRAIDYIYDNRMRRMSIEEFGKTKMTFQLLSY